MEGGFRIQSPLSFVVTRTIVFCNLLKDYSLPKVARVVVSKGHLSLKVSKLKQYGYNNHNTYINQPTCYQLKGLFHLVELAYFFRLKAFFLTFFVSLSPKIYF